MIFRSDLWEAVHLGIAAENRKIRILIHHNHTRGIAREALLRSLVIQHTPHPYIVETGLVYTDDPKNAPSKQCDILIYDPRVHQAYYQLDEFIVVPRAATRLLIEVKSSLNKTEFKRIVEMSQYAQTISLPLLVFAYQGWTFDTFCEKARALASTMNDIPFAIVVHNKNYIALRASLSVSPQCLLIDFSKASPRSPGIATAYFLEMYQAFVRDGMILDGPLWQGFRDTITIVPPESRKWFGTDGKLHDLTGVPTIPPAP